MRRKAFQSNMLGAPGRAKTVAAIISRHPVASVAAIDEALHFCHENERSALAQLLAGINSPAALAVLIRHRHLFGVSADHLIPPNHPSLTACLADALANGAGHEARNAVDIIARDEHPAHARMLATVLNAQTPVEPSIQSKAAAALLALLKAAERRPSRIQGDDLAALDGAVADSLAAWRQHRQRDVALAAAILLEHQPPRVMAMHDADDRDALRTVLSAVDRIELPAVRRRLVRWLSVPALARRAAVAMQGIRGERMWQDILATAHLLRDPVRRAAMRAAAVKPRDVPDAAMLSRMPVALQAQFPLFIMACAFAPAVRVRILAQAAELPHPLPRLNALVALLAHRSATAWSAVAAFCFDAEPSIALLAARHLVTHADRTSDADRMLVEHLCDSPHPRVVSLAVSAMASMNHLPNQSLLTNPVARTSPPVGVPV